MLGRAEAQRASRGQYRGSGECVDVSEDSIEDRDTYVWDSECNYLSIFLSHIGACERNYKSI